MYCVGGNANIGKWLRGSFVYAIDRADVVIFPGGPDVNPLIYGEKRHPMTSVNEPLDTKDITEYNKALSLNKKIIGICRGAQLMCAMAGGKLVQHQQDMASRHPICTYDGNIVRVSSSHHQAMFPWEMPEADFKVLGWGLEESEFHEGADQKEMVKGKAPLDMEVEVAFFPKINALGIQAHPEWQYPTIATCPHDRTAVLYFQDLVQKFMDGDKFTDAHAAFATD